MGWITKFSKGNSLCLKETLVLRTHGLKARGQEEISVSYNQKEQLQLCVYPTEQNFETLCIFFKLFYCFAYVRVLPVCMPVLCGHNDMERRGGCCIPFPPRTRITDGYEPPCACWRSSTQVLWKSSQCALPLSHCSSPYTEQNLNRKLTLRQSHCIITQVSTNQRKQ